MSQQVKVVSLRDLARAPVMVPVSRGEIPVRGLNAHAWLRIYERFPDFDKMSDDMDNPDTRKTLLRLMPAVIVEGLGLHGDPEAYALAEDLSDDDQAVLFSEIMRITQPPGGAKKSAPLAQSSTANKSRRRRAERSRSASPPSELAAAANGIAVEDTKVQVITLQ